MSSPSGNTASGPERADDGIGIFLDRLAVLFVARFPLPVQETSLMFPILRLGSTGQSVRTLQEALNLWPDSGLAPLRVDYSFGPKTDGKVREFQSKNRLGPDGVVGPATWDMLKPLVDPILGKVLAPSFFQAGDRIAAAAEIAVNMLGWAGGPVVRNPLSPKIAAALCADRSDPLRPRQGGPTLLTLFTIAGASGQHTLNCPRISQKAEDLWQTFDTDKSARQQLNRIDLPAWCGIFCYYIYKCAGIDLGGWMKHDDNMVGCDKDTPKRFLLWRRPEDAFRGCIGVIDPGEANHHFIVMDNDPKTGKMNSIDGNRFGPNPAIRGGTLASVITRDKYLYTTLRTRGCYFLFPNFLKA